jgi:formate dehydrogenase major subunit
MQDRPRDHVPVRQEARLRNELCKNIKVVNNEPVIEDILREINRSCWTIGYTGCSPERLKLHMQNKHTFNPTTLRAEDGPCKGDYYGLPWPCWGTPELKHPGTPILYDINKPVIEGGLPFRANWGVEHNGEPCWRPTARPTRARTRHRLPGIRPRVPEKTGLVGRADAAGAGHGRGQELEDRPVGRHHPRRHRHGCAPYGNARARCQRLELPGPGAGAPRAAAVAAPRPGRQVSDLRRQGQFLAPADALQVGAGRSTSRRTSR